MKKLAFALALFSLSFGVNASLNTTCVYPVKTNFENDIAQFSNENGWTVHCNAKFIGGYYATNGLNLKDLQVIADKSNQVLAQGQAPITGQVYGEGAVFLYNLFQGNGVAQVAEAMAMQVVNNFFGATNQYGTFCHRTTSVVHRPELL